MVWHRWFDLSTGYVERAAEALGREVAEDEKLVVEPPEADEPLDAAECRLVL